MMKGAQMRHRTRVLLTVAVSLIPSACITGSDRDADWTFLEYALTDADHLRFRVVDTTPFEDVVDDPPSVRQRLAEQMQDPEVLVGLLSCTRSGPQQ